METYTVLHGDAYQVTPVAADGALTCKIRNVSVFGRRGGYLADLSKKKGSGTMAGPPLALAFRNNWRRRGFALAVWIASVLRIARSDAEESQRRCSQ